MDDSHFTCDRCSSVASTVFLFTSWGVGGLKAIGYSCNVHAAFIAVDFSYIHGDTVYMSVEDFSIMSVLNS